MCARQATYQGHLPQRILERLARVALFVQLHKQVCAAVSASARVGTHHMSVNCIVGFRRQNSRRKAGDSTSCTQRSVSWSTTDLYNF